MSDNQELNIDAEPFYPQEERLLDFNNVSPEDEDEIQITNEWIEDLAELGCLEMEHEMQMRSELLNSLHVRIDDRARLAKRMGSRSEGKPHTWPRYINFNRYPMTSHNKPQLKRVGQVMQPGDGRHH